MELISGQPASDLKDYIKEYYYISLSAINKSIPVIDDCAYDVVFFKEAKAKLVYNKPAQELKINQRMFTIHDLFPPYKIEFNGDLSFFTIKLQPWYNASFFSQFSNPGIYDISSYLKGSNAFMQSVFEEQNALLRFELADDFMLQYRPQSSDLIMLIKDICLLIIKEKGLISVNGISDHFSKSRQYLNKVFKKQVLYSLKKYIITVRILDLIKHKTQYPDITLTELAYLYEYFDQAHFIRDFKNVCGVPPKVFFDDLPEFMLRH